jgi:hypothetical protein
MHTTHLGALWAMVVPMLYASWTTSPQVLSTRQHAVHLDRLLQMQPPEHLLPSLSTSLRPREQSRPSSDQRRLSATRDLPLLRQDHRLHLKPLLRLHCLPPQSHLVAPTVKVALSHSVLSDPSHWMVSLPCSRVNPKQLANNCLT